MKKCSKCLLEVPESYRLCPQCGTGTLVSGDQDTKPVNRSSFNETSDKNVSLNNSSVNNQPHKKGHIGRIKNNHKSNFTAASKKKKTKRPKRIPMLKPWAVSVLALSCVLIFLAIFNAGDSLAMWAVNNTSLEDEKSLVSEEVVSIEEVAYEANHPEAILLNEIGQNLVSHISPESEYKYHFYLVPQSDINAFAIPGGYIVMFEGLYTHLSPEETAAVLSHEIIHVENKHTLKSYYKSISNGLLFAWMLGLNDDIGRDFVNYLTNSSYGRGLETEADLEGLELMQQAGYDPKHMVDMLNKFDEIDGDGLVDKIPSWLLSHPQSRERAEAVENAIRLEGSK